MKAQYFKVKNIDVFLVGGFFFILLVIIDDLYSYTPKSIYYYRATIFSVASFIFGWYYRDIKDKLRKHEPR
jgi:hypothetical protein